MNEQLNMFEFTMKELPIVTSLKLGTFFSGIGAPETALENIGIKVKLQFFSEIDKHAIASYKEVHNQTDAKSVGSITDLKGKDLPYCDMWFGGFPCQDISLAGKGKGFSIETESRSSLGWEMIRLAREVEVKPTYIVFENVAAIYNNTHRPILNLFKRDLEDLGYTLYNSLLNSKDYGIPQSRNRYFLVAILGEYSYKFPQKQKLDLRLKDMLEDEVDEKYYLSDKMLSFFQKNSEEQKAKGNGFRFEPQDGSRTAKAITTKNGSRMDDNFIIQLNNPKHSNNRVYSSEGLAPTLKTMQTGGNQQPFIAVEKKVVKKGNYSPSGHNASSVVGEEGIAPTVMENHGTVTAVEIKGVYLDQLSRGVMNEAKEGLSTTLKAQVGHNGIVEDSKIRKLTPLECWRLQGFSDDAFRKAEKVCSNSQLYKQAGNSITVDVLEAIFTNLLLGGIKDEK